jgi:pentatricopeptide repeat protein
MGACCTAPTPSTATGCRGESFGNNALGLESRHLESRPKAAARLVLEVSAGWPSSSSRGLWGGDALLLSTGRAANRNPGVWHCALCLSLTPVRVGAAQLGSDGGRMQGDTYDAVVAALCRAQQSERAMRVASWMRSNGHSPSAATTAALVQVPPPLPSSPLAPRVAGSPRRRRQRIIA